MNINVAQNDPSFIKLAADIKEWGQALGFQQVAITDTDLQIAEKRLQHWLAKGYHGTMEFMERHGLKRSRPNVLIPGTVRVITARMDYLPPDPAFKKTLRDRTLGFISRYAIGNDYHKLIRKRLQKLADQIEAAIEQPLMYRAFADSAPVMEKPLAEKAGLGWIGKNTNLIHAQAGTWFFLGTLYVDIPLPIDEPATNHCGSCSACLDVCPTQAIVAPYQLDANRCISYLTIELKGSIPVEFRPLIGNRIYGCDDCLLICPWNKFARVTKEHAFHPRHGLDQLSLLEALNWSEADFLHYTEGSAIRRIGHQRWLRNVAVALGNGPKDAVIIAALQARLQHPSALVREHVQWALDQ